MSSVETALRRLKSENPSHRLEGARYLANNSRVSEEQALREAMARESVQWIRAALRRALERVSPTDAPPDLTIDRDDAPAGIAAQVHSEALETTTAQLIHEIEPLVGSLKLAAQAEIPDYEASRTRAAVDRLDDLLEALARLRRAASAPKMEEFDLGDLVGECIDDVPFGNGGVVQRAGPTHCIAVGDKTLVRMCVLNGIRNAVEATIATNDAAHDLPITVAWGSTDQDYWVSVIDLGVGFKGNLQRAFDIGTSTKEGHLGMGLAITNQSIISMAGKALLVPNARGTRFEIRWPAPTGDL